MESVFSSAKLAWGGILLFIDINFATPTFNLFFFVCGAIILDFATGVAKSVMLKKARTSEGYRKTVVKLMQYITPIIILWLSSKRLPGYQTSLQQMCGWLMMFIIYIEVTSIFENLYEIDKESPVANYLYKPALKILKFGIENNPVVKAAEKQEAENNKQTDK